MRSLFFPLFVAVSLAANDSLEFGLKSFVKSVLKEDPNIKVAKLQKEIFKKRVEYGDAVFTPNIFLNLDYKDTKTPNSTEESISRGYFSTYTEKLQSYELGFNGFLPYGANWSLSYKLNSKESNLIDRYKDYSKEYSGVLSFQLTQPLLNGFGEKMVKKDYFLAKSKSETFSKEYEKKVSDAIFDAVKSYWKYYKSEKMLDYQQKILKQM